MSATRNWTIAGAATVALGTVTGIAFATDGIDLQDHADAIQLASATKFADGTADEVIGVDVSPESADSPAESPFDSPESPTDSPDDPGWVDPSPESVDSPAESPGDSPESPADSPDDPFWVDPSPESADSPANGRFPGTCAERRWWWRWRWRR